MVYTSWGDTMSATGQVLTDVCNYQTGSQAWPYPSGRTVFEAWVLDPIVQDALWPTD